MMLLMGMRFRSCVVKSLQRGCGSGHLAVLQMHQLPLPGRHSRGNHRRCDVKQSGLWAEFCSKVEEVI